MDPNDAASRTSRLKRKIPPVTEVIDHLARELKTEPYGGGGRLFEAAQKVCADELRRLKEVGGDPVSLAVLVGRARRIIDPSAPVVEEVLASSEDDPFDVSGSAAPFPPAAAEAGGPFSLAETEADMTVLSEPRPPRAEPAPEASLPFEPEIRPSRPLDITPLSRPRPAPPTLGASHREEHHILPVFLVAILFLAGAAAGLFYFRSRRVAVSAPSAPASRPRPAASRRSPAPPAGSTTISPAPASRPAAAPPASRTAAAPPPASGHPASASSTVGISRPALPEAPPARASASPAPPAALTPAPVRQSHGGEIVSADWEGKAPIYAVHFSSYKERGNAERDALRLSKKYGRPAHAVEVELGPKGRWNRVLVGEFASVEEARKYREELAAAHAPDLGQVYHLTGP
jgi:SPOR domain